MEWQTVINIIGGAVLTAVGWFAREIWDAVKELRKDIQRIENNLPEVYVRRDDFKHAIDEMKVDLREVRQDMKSGFTKLEGLIGQLFDRVNEKADK